jgi:hypothetical protein
VLEPLLKSADPLTEGTDFCAIVSKSSKTQEMIRRGPAIVKAAAALRTNDEGPARGLNSRQRPSASPRYGGMLRGVRTPVRTSRYDPRQVTSGQVAESAQNVPAGLCWGCA